MHPPCIQRTSLADADTLLTQCMHPPCIERTLKDLHIVCGAQVIKPARLPTNAEMSKRGDKARGSRNIRQRDLQPGSQDSMPWLHCAKHLYK